MPALGAKVPRLLNSKLMALVNQDRRAVWPLLQAQARSQECNTGHPEAREAHHHQKSLVGVSETLLMTEDVAKAFPVPRLRM